MLLHIHPDNPNPRNVKTVVECLLDGGVIIYPTDTIYGLGCDIFQHKAIEKICKIKNIDVAKANLSFICYDLSVQRPRGFRKLGKGRLPPITKQGSAKLPPVPCPYNRQVFTKIEFWC